MMFCSNKPNTLDGGARNAPAPRRRSLAVKAIKATKTASTADTTANFWDLGTYKRVIKRIDDGGLLIDDFKSMLQERASIERRYAAMLKDWKKKWETKLEKGPENKESSLYSAWVDVLDEASHTSQIHSDIDNKLTDLSNSHVGAWRKTHFAKGKLGKYKATRKAEEGFNKAQNRYAKLRVKFDKVHKTYTQAKDTVEALTNKVSDSQLSADERFKLTEKIKKSSMERDRHRFECLQRLARLKEDIPRYQQGMRETFTLCQDVEQKRIEFLKQSLALFVHALEPGIAPESVAAARAALVPVNSDADVVRYGEKYGDGMPLVLPVVDADDQVMTAGLAEDGESVLSPDMRDDLEEDDHSDDDTWEHATVPPPPATHPTKVALYDYTAEDAEELSLQAGDVITQLEPQDDKGWAKGVDADGKIGFYPAHYVRDSTDSGPPDTASDCGHLAHSSRHQAPYHVHEVDADAVVVGATQHIVDPDADLAESCAETAIEEDYSESSM
eukprot:m.32446 g.32446  ORF g.32446 m.32446 type:complete len:500 (-) comp4891_c0_seq1:247-1746(-)